jgi:hypothetical protein
MMSPKSCFVSFYVVTASDAKLRFAFLFIVICDCIGAFDVFFTDSITGKDSDDLVLLSDWCVGRISFRVLLGYTKDDCDG